MDRRFSRKLVWRRMARSGGDAGLVVLAVIATQTGCGGTVSKSTGDADRADAADNRMGSGGTAGASSFGSSPGFSLIPCDDGTGSTNCCPLSTTAGQPCDGTIPRCSRGGCRDGFI